MSETCHSLSKMAEVTQDLLLDRVWGAFRKLALFLLSSVVRRALLATYITEDKYDEFRIAACRSL